MKLTRIYSVLTVFAAVLLLSCQAEHTSFVHVEDGKFVGEDYPAQFVLTKFG